jgi:HAD superfamily hydrolase (TIGR01509 family)
LIRAILFDCNGIIIDDEPIHLRLFQKVLQEEGISLSPQEYYQKYLALDDRSCYKEVLREHQRVATDSYIQKLIRKKAHYYQKVIAEELRIFPGVQSFVKKHQKHYMLGVVSGALRHEIDLILERAGIISAYSVIVSTEDVQMGKPNPEGYLLAWEKLNTLPKFKNHPLKAQECLVIEDSIHGIEAAHHAGMKCLAVTNSYPKEKLTHADCVVDTLEGLRVETLQL